MAERADRQRDDLDFRVLRMVQNRLDISQRDIAESVGISFGAVNFYFRAWRDKGHLKITNLGRP